MYITMDHNVHAGKLVLSKRFCKINDPNIQDLRKFNEYYGCQLHFHTLQLCSSQNIYFTKSL